MTFNSSGSSPTGLPAWHELLNLKESIQDQSILELFNKNPARSKQFSIQHDELFLDYSKNLIDDQVMSSLLSLADQSALSAHTEAMFAGEPINTTEQRAVLHVALRGKTEDNYIHNGIPVHPLIAQELEQVSSISDQIRQGKWLGSTGKAITDVIHLGVGGSELGPRMACQALKAYAHPALKIHFVSNADGAEILTTTKSLNPETTLIIIASKSFTTEETMLNAHSAINWLEENLGLSQAQSSTHVIGITAKRENALAFGIDPSRILEFQEWVGGRYSLWSSIGLPIAISIGFTNFEAILHGAREMDIHFKTTPFERNMPVILALLGIWYSNFLNAQTIAVIPYCERLTLLPDYLQQLDMESNGKSVSLNGDPVNYTTAPILWGQTGTDGQHAFFQLLHQGSHLVPIDFIAAVNDPLSNEKHHNFLLNNLLAQAAALMTGKGSKDTPTHKLYPGNKPSNILLMNELSPKNFGALVALYEHKVFVQGSIWNINSYDQWGVELGKQLTRKLLSDDNSSIKEFDGSTQQLSEYIRQHSLIPKDNT
ncbi:MAG: glucose-6-phosphate isomerase [Porticoccus sp.]